MTIVLAVVLVIWIVTTAFLALLYIQYRGLTDALNEMNKQRKEFELRSNETSQRVEQLAASYLETDGQIVGGVGKLADLETQLRSLVASLNEFVTDGNDIQSLKYQLQKSGDERRKASDALETMKREVKQLEEDYNSAARRISELNVELGEVRKRTGTEEIPAERGAIQEAVHRAAELASNQAVTPEAKLALKTAEEEGAIIMKALDAGLVGDAEKAATIIDASFFDPFVFHPGLWEGTIAAKRTLEMARAAAIEAMGPAGFSVDRPRIGRDGYDRDRHDLRDSIPTTSDDLWGKIAEVRRPGFLYQGRVIRPARVVQYAMDVRRTVESSVPVEAPPVKEAVAYEPPPVVETQVPVQPTIQTQGDSTAKRKGVDGF